MENAKNIRFAIAFEGTRDLKPLEILIERILKPHNYNPIILKRITPRTGLIGYVKVYAKRFFESGEAIDIAVFLTDQDKQKKSVKKRLQLEISKVKPNYKDVSVIGVPDPHFETWLLADEGYVKSYFSLPGTEPLPKPDYSPKDRLEYLQRNMNDPQIPKFQVYEELASLINLETTMSLRKDFRTFVAELLSVCKFFA